jgi:maltose alpha-D-glucosyltransferase/alpha-amylase
MQWSASEQNAGFSDAPAENLYLPIGEDVDFANVQSQESDPDSLLHFIRTLIRLRKETPCLGNSGKIELVHAPDGGAPLVYKRYLENDTVYIAVNPASRPAEADLAHENPTGTSLLGPSPKIVDGRLSLLPVSYQMFR